MLIQSKHVGGRHATPRLDPDRSGLADLRERHRLALRPVDAVAGRLPGDIRIERDNFRFYFPLMTCIVLSGLLTAILWVVRWLSK
jgi:hypothetical protein